MRKFFFLILTGLFLISANAQNKLVADTAKSKLIWTGEKVLGEHTGTVKLQSGWINWQDNTIPAGEFYINVSSLEDSEDNKKLEGHLKSADFFSVDKFPTAKLQITGSTKFEKGKGEVNGTLTIKDISNPLAFKAAMQEKDGGIWFFTNITIDRSKYDIRFGSGSFFDNLGDKTIYDDFKLRVNVFVK